LINISILSDILCFFNLRKVSSRTASIAHGNLNITLPKYYIYQIILMGVPQFPFREKTWNSNPGKIQMKKSYSPLEGLGHRRQIEVAQNI